MTATNPDDNRLQVRLSQEYQEMVAWLKNDMHLDSDSATVRRCIYEKYIMRQEEIEGTDNCSFPDCGCPEARLCQAKNGPNSGARTMNREKRQ